MRIVVTLAIVAIAVLAVVAWNMSTERVPAPSEATGESAPTPGGGAPGEVEAPAPADPGVAWNVPKSWTTDLAQGMRYATYVIPAPKGGAAAECAVYYFGPGQGGGVDANIQRWIGEFRTLDQHDIVKSAPGGVKVTTVDARGTYVAHSMRTTEPAGEKPSWALLGAVAEGPQGDIFFKLTGPEATVGAAAADFNRMLGSIRKK